MAVALALMAAGLEAERQRHPRMLIDGMVTPATAIVCVPVIPPDVRLPVGGRRKENIA